MERALEASLLFSGMTGQEARMCLACSGAFEEQHGKGALIFAESDPPERLYVLLEGAVNVCRESTEGRRAVMARVDAPGDLFGEVHVFLGRPSYGCSVLAETPVRILGIPARFFCAQGFFSHTPHFTAVLRQLAAQTCSPAAGAPPP